MKTHLTKLAALLVVAGGALTLAACDDEEMTGPDPRPEAAVYVVHGINGTDIGAGEALPVDVEVSGQGCVLEGVEFREIRGPLTLPAGTYDIRVRLAAQEACTGDVAIEAAGVELTDGDNVSVTAHLAEGGSPTASLFANDVSRADGQARVSPRHAADFGEVDVVVNGSAAFESVPNGAFATAELAPGTYNVQIQTPDNQTTAFEADLTLEAGTLYAAYAVGSVANGTFEVLLQAITF